MAGLGTIVNVAGILAGCGVGLLLKGGLPKRLQDTISSAVGLCVVFVGITGALKGLMTINGGSFETRDTLVSVVCIKRGFSFYYLSVNDNYFTEFFLTDILILI